MFSDLFAVLRDELDLTLIKGGGAAAERERVPAFLPRNGWLLRHVPLHWLIGRTRHHVECLSFVLGLLPWLRAGHFDLVHVIDPPVARLLFHLRRRLRLPFRLLFTEGGGMPPANYPPADHLHHVAPAAFEASCRLGYRRDALSLIPIGIRPGRFAVTSTRTALRAQHGIAETTFVVLCVAALSRRHKRTDHLIDEFARLDGDGLLWLDGSTDHGNPELAAFARTRLGARCRVTCVPSHQVGELYHLADVKVLASLVEPFGLVIPEALSCGTPVLAHASDHFRWLIGSEANLVDMSRPGVLAAALRRLRDNPRERSTLQPREAALRRFDWQQLKGDYLGLYETVLAAPRRPHGYRSA